MGIWGCEREAWDGGDGGFDNKRVREKSTGLGSSVMCLERGKLVADSAFALELRLVLLERRLFAGG